MNLKCEICGKFISYFDLDTNRAVHRMVTPSSHLTNEEWETFHKKCLEDDEALINKTSHKCQK